MPPPELRGNMLECQLVVEPDCASVRLTELGIPLEIIHDAIAMGEAERNSCTDNDPVSLPGTLAWGRTIRGLRELLAPNGWSRLCEGGLEYVVSPDGKMAVLVTGGDVCTSHSSATPKTRRGKGRSTVAAVERNRQLSLFESATVADSDDNKRGRTTWLLLVYRGQDEVRCELSLPAAVGDYAKVDTWLERIVLPPLNLEPRALTPLVEAEPDLVVEVTRRRAS